MQRQCVRPPEFIHHLNTHTDDASGAKIWFHALRNRLVAVADQEPLLPTSLTKRLIDHAPSRDITERYVAELT